MLRCPSSILPVVAGLLLTALTTATFADQPAPKNIEILPVDQVREGMEGTGRTVLHGVKLTEFKVKVLGVMKDVAPGRDLVLTRLSGANLEKTGVIAGMSGSPVYIDGKLLGAVAYAWGFAREPIAGITPFEQMLEQSEKPQRSGVAKIGTTADGAMLPTALDLSRDPYEVLAEGLRPQELSTGSSLQVSMRPIALPLSSSGIGPHSLKRLSQFLSDVGVVPVAAGRAGQTAEKKAEDAPIVPGAALACGMVTGDMDLSGIGTVTHVDGNRVWGWGHPFMRSGKCEYLLRGGYIHLVNSNLNISSKMGSPVGVHGLITADVGSCIAGDMAAKPDLLPVHITVQDCFTDRKREYRVQLVRHDAMLAPLVATVLNNSIEELGRMPQEITVDLDATVRPEGLEPIQFKDTYSGNSVTGSDGIERLFGQIAVVANGLTRNPFKKARINSIECNTVIYSQRNSAVIQDARLVTTTLEPGDELKATVTMRPYKADPVDFDISLPLPDSLPPGDYVATVCDASTHRKSKFSEEPNLLVARDVAGVALAFRNQLTERNNTLFLRVPLQADGLTVDGVNLPELPASARAVFSSPRSTPRQPIRQALVTRKQMDWAVEGSTSIKFKVVKEKRLVP